MYLARLTLRHESYCFSFGSSACPILTFMHQPFRARITPSLPPTTVLIVGDNAVIADLTLTVLSELGPSGVMVRDADEAVSYLNENGAQVAAVIADGALRGQLTGVEFARFVSLAWPEIRVAVAMTSAPSEPQEGADSPQVAMFTTPILPLQVIMFLQDAARGPASSVH